MAAEGGGEGAEQTPIETQTPSTHLQIDKRQVSVPLPTLPSVNAPTSLEAQTHSLQNDTVINPTVDAEQTIQPPVSNLPKQEPILIPVTEGRHRAIGGPHIHIPRYLKHGTSLDWKYLPPSSLNSPVIAQQQLVGVNRPIFPMGIVRGSSPSNVNWPENPSGVNSPQEPGNMYSPMDLNETISHQNLDDVNTPSSAGRPLFTQSPKPEGVNSPKAGLPASGGPHQSDWNTPLKMQQRSLLPAHHPGGAHLHNLPHGAIMVNMHQPQQYPHPGAVPNVTYPPLIGTIPGTGQLLQLNIPPPPLPSMQQYGTASGAAHSPGPLRRPPNMIGDVPKAKDAEKRRERERVRRAIMANIISGLRNYGGYNLPPTAPDIEYIRALLREAGYVTNVDGTTYRQGAIPPLPLEPPPDTATSSRDDEPAQDTPPSTSMRRGDPPFSFRQQLEAGQSEREAGGQEPGGITGGIMVTGEPTGGTLPEEATGGMHRAQGLADELIVEPLDEGSRKRLIEGESGQEEKRLRSS